MPTLRDIAQEGPNSLRELQSRYAATSLRHLVAGYIVKQKYQDVGECFSDWGLPIDGDLNALANPITLKNGEHDYAADFRGGQIRLNDVDFVPVEDIRSKVKVWFVGLECQVRQESNDKVYGSVGVIIPSTKRSDPHHFPEGTEFLQMSADGTRTSELEMLVYDDVPADIVLNCTLVEHDSGDISKYKKKMAEVLENGAKAGLAAVGVPAEATAADQGWLGDLTLQLANELTGWLGADDDAYNPRAVRISAKEILVDLGIRKGSIQGVTSPFQNKTMEREDTPGVVLKYNMGPIIVSGTDQGGDTGRYAFYFKVETYWVEEDR